MYRLWPMICLNSQELERNMIGKMVIGRSGKKYINRPQNTKISVPHVNAQQSVPSAERDFNDQMDRRISYLLVSQPFPPGTSCHCLMGSEKKCPWCINGIYTWTQQHEPMKHQPVPTWPQPHWWIARSAHRGYSLGQLGSYLVTGWSR